MPQCRHCLTDFPDRVHAGGRTWNLRSRKFCPSCSPLGSRNTRGDLVTHPQKLCPSCGKGIAAKRASYCNNTCLADHQYTTYIIRWKQGLETGMNRIGEPHRNGSSRNLGISNHIRRYLFEKFNSSCSECSWSRVNPTSGRIPLTIEHKDGNFLNTTEDNLELLCPCCHSLTPTYGALNRGKGRRVRLKNLAVQFPVGERDEMV